MIFDICGGSPSTPSDEDLSVGTPAFNKCPAPALQ